jgi:hypothetical protein
MNRFIRYWDSSSIKYVSHTGETIRSGAGFSATEYGVLYRLDDGRFMSGVRHTDRGDLMTNIRLGRTIREAMPARWR